MQAAPKQIILRMRNRDLALFKYIMESYENLAVLSSQDPAKEITVIHIPDGNYNTVMKLLSNLSDRFKFQILKDETC